MSEKEQESIRESRDDFMKSVGLNGGNETI